MDGDAYITSNTAFRQTIYIFLIVDLYKVVGIDTICRSDDE